ncbi:MAG: cytochrome oxidase putative small subunit CydP [Polaromonas sp.]
MNPQDKILVKKLALALVIKLAVLTALWWGFVRDQRVAVDDKSVATQLMDRGAESPKERIK